MTQTEEALCRQNKVIVEQAEYIVKLESQLATEKMSAEKNDRYRGALEKIANTPQLKGCCNKWEHCDCLDIANDIAREALEDK